MLYPQNSKFLVLGFNGKPHSGKDTACDYLRLHRNVVSHKLAAPLVVAYCAMIGITETEYYMQKELHRSHLIDFSETYVKHSYGRNHWAKLLIPKLLLFPHINCISDLGFIEEVNTLNQWTNLHVIYIDRPNYSDIPDSREDLSYYAVGTILNDGTRAEFHDRVKNFVESLVGFKLEL